MSDTFAEIQKDTIKKSPVENLSTPEEIEEYINSLPEAEDYKSGIIMSAVRYAPEYAKKLLENEYSKFIVVDKARMKVLLYDKYGHELKNYDMACARNYGTKHKRADSRTPEGFFSVEGIYNSTDWLYTDDNGNTSQKKGQFGPRFIRLRIPTTSQIGIHGTCSPWSMGHRASHGCIRILNENILELVELVEPGMPVIVLPGKRDRAVNRKEGYAVAYFPTDDEYAMSQKERQLKPLSAEEVAENKRIEEKIRLEKAKADSLANAGNSINENSEKINDANKPFEVDSI
ncbi:MAG: L,D-transpeptidase family protein [Candidatus Amulumruptor caecigallinarius]|nr:L,D-transpeptidase family protein [Candidatus Amulumruptor caecigallinarius]